MPISVRELLITIYMCVILVNIVSSTRQILTPTMLKYRSK